MKRRTSRLGLSIGLLALWMAVSACSCASIVETVRVRQATSESPVAAKVEPTAAPTLASTKTKPTPVAATVAPTATPPEKTSVESQPTLSEVEPSAELVIEATQTEINEYLATETFDLQGVIIRDVHVTLTEQEIIVDLNGAYEEMGISTGITARGVPVVVDGLAYVRIEDVQLDDSLPGFTRLIARNLIEKAIEDNSTPNGIPIPYPDIYLDSVELLPGAIRLKGRTL